MTFFKLKFTVKPVLELKIYRLPVNEIFDKFAFSTLENIIRLIHAWNMRFVQAMMNAWYMHACDT